MESIADALNSISKAWPAICKECLSVLGSELHYQAMIYHCLRHEGEVPIGQLGMNVKMWIGEPVSELFKQLDILKHEDYQGGFEPIPDIVLFASAIDGDWRRRSNQSTLRNILVAIEVKASERKGKRLTPGETRMDIAKLAAQREEIRALGADMYGIMMIIDSARDASERMTKNAIDSALSLAKQQGVGFMYCSPERVFSQLEDSV